MIICSVDKLGLLHSHLPDCIIKLTVVGTKLIDLGGEQVHAVFVFGTHVRHFIFHVST